MVRVGWLTTLLLFLSQSLWALDSASLTAIRTKLNASEPNAVASQIAPRPPDSGIEDGEILILDVYLKRHHLGHIIGIKEGNQAKLGLADFAHVLDFPITVSLDPISAIGWARREDTPFSLQENGENYEVMNTSGVTAIPISEMVIEDDIFVSSQYLDKWFAIKSTFTLNKLRIDIESLIPIPLEERLEREYRAKHGKVMSNQARFDTKQHDYDPLSAPLLDIQFSSNSYQDQSNANLSILGANDLAYLSAQYFLLTDQNGDLNNARLHFKKLSPNAELFGSATSLTFGDISSTKTNALASGTEGIGIRLQNLPLNSHYGNEVVLRGNVLPGWDVEIYRNKLLIDSQIAVQTGEYLFEHVPLLFGANNIEVVLYGPQGQVERHYESYYVGATTGKRSTVYYDVSLTQEGTQLIETQYSENLEDLGTTLSAFGRLDMTDWFSINGGLKRYLDGDYQDTDTDSWGTRTSLLGLALLQTDHIEQHNGSYEDYYQFTTGMEGHALTFSYRDKENIESGTKTLDREIWQLRLNGYNPKDRTQSWEQSIEYISEQSESYGRYYNQIGWSFGDHYFSHQLTLQNNPFMEANMLGEFNWQHYWSRVFSRFTINYDLAPKSQLTDVTVDLNSTLSDSATLRLNHTRDLLTDTYQSYASLGWRPKSIAVSLRIGEHNTSGYFASLFAQTSIGKTPDHRFFASNRSLVNRGSVAVRVFHDVNNNQIFDAGDTALSGVVVKSIQQPGSAITDSDGIAMLAALSIFDTTDLKVDTGTIPDLFLMPSTAGVSVSPRPGAVQTIDMPMVTIGEIEGTIFQRTPSGLNQPLAYAPIQVFNEQNQLIAESISEFDGFYLVTDLPPGSYQITIADAFIKTQSLLTPEPIQRSITEAKPIITAANLTVRAPRNSNRYATTIGQFASLTSLKLFMRLNQDKVPKSGENKWFYTQETGTEDSLYLLHAGHYATRDNAVDACEALISQSFTCEVTSVTLN